MLPCVGYPQGRGIMAAAVPDVTLRLVNNAKKKLIFVPLFRNKEAFLTNSWEASPKISLVLSKLHAHF